jgi:Uma2 family endonuclease
MVLETADERRPRRRFTADEVMRMVEIGVLRPDERVELIEGELIVVSPQGAVHAGLTAVVREVLEGVYGLGFYVRDHSPVVGTEHSIPEPDVAVVLGKARDFMRRWPGPSEVPLVVEIADTTLSYERRKTSVYAKAGYALHWIIDVEHRRVECRSGPQPDGTYLKTEIVGADAELTPPGAARSVRIADLLP